MNNVTPYDIAIIGGSFTMVGAVIGAIIAYWLTKKLEVFKEHRAACAKLRAAFAPALGQIYLAQSHADHDRPSVEDFIRTSLLPHAAAIEEFRPFVTSRDHAGYQEAWENYLEFANNNALSTAEDWTTGSALGTALKQRIDGVLYFSKEIKPPQSSSHSCRRLRNLLHTSFR